jgi:methylated-DNA-[protein]-cysteine S-methyltransferase
MSVWRELLKIPYGETATYGDIAKRIDNPKAVRAVGLANGRNPLPIVIPCHRVIGANRQLTGFGGGLENKALLLKIEESV